tara:strand:+ start:155 stop:451 length:297 start_codon:yes stop_codon:yes gene_type:complete
MEKDKHITEVIFRFDKEYGVYALFPYEIDTYTTVSSYAHVGQHSGANYQHCINTSRPATEVEYKDLFNELENYVGYNLKVVKKMSYQKWKAAHDEAFK